MQRPPPQKKEPTANITWAFPPISREVLEEAQEMAVSEHGVEYGTNLWVAESFAVQSLIVKGMRRHARGRMGEVRSKK